MIQFFLSRGGHGSKAGGAPAAAKRRWVDLLMRREIDRRWAALRARREGGLLVERLATGRREQLFEAMERRLIRQDADDLFTILSV